MSKILYISLTGMTEPLGESQVVQYLLALSKIHSIYLISFEKPSDRKKKDELSAAFAKSTIHWQYFTYSNFFGILSTLKQILQAFFFASRWIKKNQIQIIHARSFVPAIIGLLLKKLHQIKLLFDIRGFAIDEKIIEGRLKSNAFLTKCLKKLEKIVYQHADHIVTLTHVSAPIINQQYNVSFKYITVIPTCANKDLFRNLDENEKLEIKKEMGLGSKDLIILHNGSLNGCVDFIGELKLFKELFLLNNNAKFIILNKNQHADIERQIKSIGLEKNSYKIFSADFHKVYQYLNIADFCVFFIKPSFAKKASAPTKFAETIACHTYYVTNKHYGDMEFYFNKYSLGVLLELDSLHENPKKAAYAVINFLQETYHKHADHKKRF